jgi:RNA polymerase sigma-70 factor, ECF subfamily
MRNSDQEHPAEPMETSDEALMIAYAQGDETALAALVRRYANRLLGYLVRMVADRAQAEDVFQETFLRVHRHAASFRPERRFKPWLFAIASNLAIDVLRRRQRSPIAVSLDAPAPSEQPMLERVPDPAPDPAANALRDEQRTLVRKALDALPPGQRSVVVLAYLEGLSYAETAQSLGCSIGTVKKQVSRALQTLARLLPNPPARFAEGGVT